MVKFKGVLVQNPTKPKHLQKGGFVRGFKQSTLKQKQNDSVYAMLTPGELVIPKKHTQKVKRYLKRKNIKLPS